MTRVALLAFLLVACSSTQQRDAALGAIVAGSAASLACHAAAEQTEGHQLGYSACVAVGVGVSIGGGVVLHSQLEQARPAGEDHD